MGAETGLGGLKAESRHLHWPMELGAREVSSTGISPARAVLWEPNLGPKGRLGPGTLGAGVRPRPASPVLRVIKNDSVDRFACCLLIYSDPFMGTAGWVPAGQPHRPPAARQPARCRGTYSSAGAASAGPGPQPLRGCWPGQAGDGVQPCGPEPLTDSRAGVGGVWRVGQRPSGVGETPPAGFYSRSYAPIQPEALGLGGSLGRGLGGDGSSHPCPAEGVGVGGVLAPPSGPPGRPACLHLGRRVEGEAERPANRAHLLPLFMSLSPKLCCLKSG